MFNHSFVKRSQAQLKIAKKLIFVVKSLFFSLFSGIKVSLDNSLFTILKFLIPV